MRIKTRVDLFLGFLLVVALMMVVVPALASERRGNNNDCNGVGNCNDIEIEVNEGGDGYGGDGGEGGSATSDASSESDATATATAGAEAGASVGDITIEGDTIPADTTHRAKITLENTPDIVTITPGSGDDCKAHIGFGASIPGVGASMNIPLPGKECRKLKAYDRAVLMNQWQAAEIMFCSLKEVKAEFRSFDLDCIETLTLYVVPLPEPVGVLLTDTEYRDLVAQAEAAEQVEEYAEQSEYRYAQQQHLIEALEEEHDDDQAEIDALKKKVNDEVAEADARRAAVRAKYAAKEAETDGSENPDK